MDRYNLCQLFTIWKDKISFVRNIKLIIAFLIKIDGSKGVIVMNLYYESIFDDPRLSENMGIAVRDNFKKFESYLGLAIDSLKSKGKIAIQWEPANFRTDIKFSPLVKAIQISATVQLDIYMEYGLLELNVVGETMFDSSAGIMLDNWTQLRPDEFEVYSISDRRHLIKILNTELYRDEKIASTRNGARAEVSPFEFKNLLQNKKSLKLLDTSYDFDRNCYRVTVEGELDDKTDIEINGYTVSVDQWSMVEQGMGQYEDENGMKLNILYSAGNILYFDGEAGVPKQIFSDHSPVQFSIVQIQPPREIIVKGEDIKIQRDEKGYYTYSKLEGRMTYFHPDYGIPLFQLAFEGDFSEGAQNELSILLKDDEEDDKDEMVTKSKIDYFLDQDTQELEGVHKGEMVSFEIVFARAEEQILRIRSKNKKPMTYDDIPRELYIKVNTYQLRKQKEAITQLKLKPLKEHKPLLALSQKKSSRNLWPDFPLADVSEWDVLTDSTREGVDAQRLFVRQALSTPDFSLLEGPPGSGKTTAILELILQLIKQNKRILLCASTHVAIDNVLERLKEEKRMDGILPLRIGDVNQVADSVKEFSIDLYRNNKYKQLMIESANLVCGTTVGILKHPLFQKNFSDDSPPVPEYDYLIIDESSKTTFQEFLIPALYAKRWVLVGDIKQLPPYNEREQIIAGIDDDRQLNPHLKAASLLVYQYVFNHRVKLPVCVVERDEVIDEVKNELKVLNKSFIKKQIGIVEEVGFDGDQYFSISKKDILFGSSKCLAMLGADVIFMKKSLLELSKDFIPAHMVVINKENWEDEQQHYRVNAYYDHHSRELFQAMKYVRKKVRNRDYIPGDFMDEQNAFLKERTWASEYGWRMVRLFELNNVENSRSKQSYAEDLVMLWPKTASENALRDISNVHDIALPSILQSLQVGVGKNRDRSLETTLNSGFNREEKQKRFVKLDYQHRMHEEISRFPRKQFYENTVLKNSKKINREWNYSRYPARNMWINVESKANRGSNMREAERLIQELKHFIKWAELNPNPQNKDGIWTVACLSFYNKQQKNIRDLLRKLTGQDKHHANFKKGNVEISNYTVDKFQGREADLTFLSMVQTDRVGFMDNPNRLNVAITRARFQRVIIGKFSFYLNNKQSEQLKFLAMDSKLLDESGGSNADHSKQNR
jgi:superfamily I DNA and/or RNA helicase